MFPLARGLIHNQFQSSTTSPYVTIIQCWSGLHPWNGYGLSGGWLFVHPWRWDCSAVIGVSMVLVPLLFCLCPFSFYSCYFVNQITDLHQCICCLRVAGEFCCCLHDECLRHDLGVCYVLVLEEDCIANPCCSRFGNVDGETLMVLHRSVPMLKPALPCTSQVRLFGFDVCHH